MGLTRVLSGPFPRFAAVLTVLGALGLAAGAGYAVDHVQFEATGIVVQNLGTAGVFAMKLPGICFPLAFLGIGLALVRAGVEPRWAGVVLSLAAVMFPVSRIAYIEPLAIAADGLFLAALWPLGWSILQGRNTAPAPNDVTAFGSA